MLAFSSYLLQKWTQAMVWPDSWGCWYWKLGGHNQAKRNRRRLEKNYSDCCWRKIHRCKSSLKRNTRIVVGDWLNILANNYFEQLEHKNIKYNWLIKNRFIQMSHCYKDLRFLLAPLVPPEELIDRLIMDLKVQTTDINAWMNSMMYANFQHKLLVSTKIKPLNSGGRNNQ